VRTALFVLCALALSACASLAWADEAVLPSWWATTNLSGEYRFRVGDDPSWASPDLDDSAWATMAVPEEYGWLRGRPRGEYAWFRKRITLPSDTPTSTGISLGLVNGAYEAFVNGVRVGSCGSVEPFASARPGHSCAFEVPAAALTDRRTALVAVRVRQSLPDGTGGPFSVRRLGSGAFFFGALEDVRGRAAADDSLSHLKGEVPPVIGLCLSLLAGIPSLWLFARRRELRAHAAFGAMTVLGVIRFPFSFPATADVMGMHVSAAADTALAWLGIPLQLEFVYALVVTRRPGRVLTVIQAACVACSLACLHYPFAVVSIVSGAVMWVTFGLLPVALWVIGREAIRGNRTARVIGVGVVVYFAVVVPFFIAVFRDPASMRLAVFTPPLLGNVVFLSSVLVLLSDQFARKLGEAEALNVDLQRQIARRSEQLGEALAKLGALPRRTLEIAVGQLVDDRYRVVRKLGAGGMGAVYEVVKEGTKERLALKVLLGARDGAPLARFAREAQVAASVRHANLVAVKDVDVAADGVMYIVMELVDGASLDALAKSWGNVEWARPILRQVASGLAALHAAGVVHRDLKPQNVMLTESGVAKLADFGIARIREDADLAAAPSVEATDPALVGTETSSGRLTREGAVMGTPAYMAPEHGRGTAGTGSAGDIWSFGVLACELVTGRAPFDVPPVHLAMLGMPLPAPRIGESPLAPLVARCLSIEPPARPTAAEIVEALA
jgi:predicted Ser/Thr protein kinase